MSVVTHRSFHLNVTKSSSVSTSEKICCSSMRPPDEGTCASEADFSTAGVAAMPGWCKERRIMIYWGLASAQSNKHGSMRTKETTE
ncbi:hypothetical protein HBI10_207030 [Parastagonospora nodorum]|nr:hypothetical protein HBI10_207030 [Parastagonospora nodorum]KAH5092498.1 hypothetical protein HBH72_188460 [Parastagonospora nodorum]